MTGLSQGIETLVGFLADEPFAYLIVDKRGGVVFENRATRRLGVAAAIELFLCSPEGQKLLIDSQKQLTPLPFSFLLNGQRQKATIRRALAEGDEVTMVIRVIDTNRMAALTRTTKEMTHASLRGFERERAENRFLALFSAARDGQAILTQSGRIVHANPAFLKLSGYDSVALSDCDIFEVFRAPIVEARARDISGGAVDLSRICPAVFDAEAIDDMKVTPVSVSITSNGSTQVPEFFINARDLTNSRRYSEVKALNDELARTNRSLDEFNRLMSHEMRAPLSRIVSAAENLSHAEGCSGGAARYVKIIDDAARDALLQYSSILSLSRGGKRTVAPLAAQSLQHKIMRQYELIAEQKGIAFSGEVFGDDGDRVPVDTSDAFLILSNLISNAIKHTASGGEVRFTITVDQSAKLVRLEVRDTGSGIPDRLRAQLFDAFVSTADGSEIESGIGVGLSLVKRAIENRHGRIEFQSEVGKGTHFCAELPFEKETIDETVVVAASKHPFDEIGLRPGDTLLLVDDDIVSLELIGARLKKQGFEAITAPGGLPALRVLKDMDCLPKLIFIDRNMPDMSGMDVTRVIRRRYPDQQCYICGLTAYVDDGITQEMLDAGMNAVEQKPLSQLALERYVKAFAAASAS